MLTKRMSNNWQGVVSMVLSKAEGRIASSARTGPSSSQRSAVGHVRAGRRRSERLRQHRRAADRRQTGRRQGAVGLQLPWGITAAANVQHQTGRLWSRQMRPAGLGFPTPPHHQHGANTGDRRVAGRRPARPPRPEDVRVRRFRCGSTYSSMAEHDQQRSVRKHRLAARDGDGIRRTDAHTFRPGLQLGAKIAGKQSEVVGSDGASRFRDSVRSEPP